MTDAHAAREAGQVTLATEGVTSAEVTEENGEAVLTVTWQRRRYPRRFSRRWRTSAYTSTCENRPRETIRRAP